MRLAIGRLPLLRQRTTLAMRLVGLGIESMGRWSRYYGVRLMLEDIDDAPNKGDTSLSMAKTLACLTDEPPQADSHTVKSPMDQMRLIELRIKKMVKAQYANDKFYNLMDMVVAHVDTLRNCYDMLRLNSCIELTSKKDDLCFSAMAEQLANGSFDVKENSVTMHRKDDQAQFLVLPNLKLRVIQEAIRVVLEIVYRPHFSKISHGCRSGRGHHSALKFAQKEILDSDWWFTISMRKVADSDVLSRLTSVMEEKIQDVKLYSFIHQLFDAKVLNLVFGVFPKGIGLPQEGALSPILMNIYLGMFDTEVIRMSLRYEVLGLGDDAEKDIEQSKLRQWFRQKIKQSSNTCKKEKDSAKENKLNVCRHMDEILVLVSGSEKSAKCIKSVMLNFLGSSLHIEAENQMEPLAVKANYHDLQFLGVIVRVKTAEAEALRAVHKMKDKLQLFVSQKEKIWDSLTVRIGKKWLGWGLRRIKESEIKSLGLSTPLLDHLSQFRKPGMKTDHWFKSLLKIWVQDVNARVESNEETLLSKYIVEPALPKDLRESFINFRTQAINYISSESTSTLELLVNYLNEIRFDKHCKKKVNALEAPTDRIKRSLLFYGVVGSQGYPKHVSALVLQDDEQIISWFSGLVRRWLRWYSECENFGYIKLLVAQCVRKSCARTLGAKYHVSEELIERNYDSELSSIPMTDELETEMEPLAYDNCYNFSHNEALTYGTFNSGLCLLTLSSVKEPSKVFNCFVMGCTAESPSLYTLYVKETQRFPGWKTGFSSSIHSSLNHKRIGLCNQHVKALYLGQISLQSIEFGVLK